MTRILRHQVPPTIRKARRTLTVVRAQAPVGARMRERDQMVPDRRNQVRLPLTRRSPRVNRPARSSPIQVPPVTMPPVTVPPVTMTPVTMAPMTLAPMAAPKPAPTMTHRLPPNRRSLLSPLRRGRLLSRVGRRMEGRPHRLSPLRPRPRHGHPHRRRRTTHRLPPSRTGTRTRPGLRPRGQRRTPRHQGRGTRARLSPTPRMTHRPPPTRDSLRKRRRPKRACATTPPE